MTPADLARVAAAIEQDAATEAANWPLSRERARAYIELARAVAPWLAEWDHDTAWYSPESQAIAAAFAALAPDADAGAVAGEAPKTQ